jgi:hypothetical protein
MDDGLPILWLILLGFGFVMGYIARGDHNDLDTRRLRAAEQLRFANNTARAAARKDKVVALARLQSPEFRMTKDRAREVLKEWEAEASARGLVRESPDYFNEIWSWLATDYVPSWEELGVEEVEEDSVEVWGPLPGKPSQQSSALR